MMWNKNRGVLGVNSSLQENKAALRILYRLWLKMLFKCCVVRL